MAKANRSLAIRSVRIFFLAVFVFAAAVLSFEFFAIYEESDLERGLAHVADTGRPYDRWSRYDLVCFGFGSDSCALFSMAAAKAGYSAVSASGCCRVTDSGKHSIGFVHGGEITCLATTAVRYKADPLCFNPSRLKVSRQNGNYTITQREP